MNDDERRERYEKLRLMILAWSNGDFPTEEEWEAIKKGIEDNRLSFRKRFSDDDEKVAR